MTKDKVPARIQRVLSRLQSGQTLCKGNAPNGGEVRFWFEPSQTDAPLQSCFDAIRRGLIVPAGDGLFGNSQTYRLPR